MKERVVYPEILAKLPKTTITAQLAACESLLHNYQQKASIGLKHCPLCASIKCSKCPWHYIAGISWLNDTPCCTYFQSHTITNIRQFPGLHKRQANARVKHLTYWIKVLNTELARRQTND